MHTLSGTALSIFTSGHRSLHAVRAASTPSSQIELGGGARIECLASVLQLRGAAPAAPRHGNDGGDLLLFNGAAFRWS